MTTFTEIEQIAVACVDDGQKPQISTGIGGELTVGFGKLDENGYWQFPLPRSHWSAHLAALSAKYDNAESNKED